MKIISGIISSTLLCASIGSASAASIEEIEVKMQPMPQIADHSRGAVFSRIVSRLTDRAIEKNLAQQVDLAVAGMYEVPIAVPVIEIEIEHEIAGTIAGI